MIDDLYHSDYLNHIPSHMAPYITKNINDYEKFLNTIAPALDSNDMSDVISELIWNSNLNPFKFLKLLEKAGIYKEEEIDDTFNDEWQDAVYNAYNMTMYKINNLKEKGFDDIVDEISTTYGIVPSLATLHGIDMAIDEV